jgi:hypothetical protein
MDAMRILIVSGHRGENWHPQTNPEHRSALDWLKIKILHGEFQQVWHGGATGVDQAAHALARKAEIDVHVFAAKWKAHGRGAGPRRNARMAAAAHRCIADGHDIQWAIMPGGTGTAHAADLALKYGIAVSKPDDPAVELHS